MTHKILESRRAIQSRSLEPRREIAKKGKGARRLRGRGGQRAGGAAPHQLCGTLTVKTTYVYNCVKNRK